MDKAERNRRLFDAYQGGASLGAVASANGLSKPGAFRALQSESRRRGRRCGGRFTDGGRVRVRAARKRPCPHGRRKPTAPV